MVFKCVLEKYDNVETTWSTESATQLLLKKEIWSILEFMPEEHILAGGKRITIKEVHFLAQLYRLPLQGPLILRKLCQVALNVGQLGAFIGNFELKDWRVYCWTQKLYPDLCKIETYADDVTQEMLGVVLAASGCRTDTLIAEFQEKIRIFDSGV